ncbi:hypothetical protein [Nocardia crassostreae]|uniref:hypothetical protein n=1 Tax=Nocardia crassostreae TaxID=53428 RepID=UPI000A057F86|nr:hypothetical protein [Nocardia crassostreae]
MSANDKTPDGAAATEEVVSLAKPIADAVAEAAEQAPVAPPAVERNVRPAQGSIITVLPLAAAAILAVVSLVLGGLWYSSSNELDDLKSAQADRDRVAEVARDYTLRSLTYDYKNLPAFFDGVQRGTSDALAGRYKEVHDTLSAIMTEAQVVATGEVAGTSVEAQGNDQYAVTVYATQRTQNVQHQDPATVPNLLVVTVAKNGGDWVVVDYGPKDAAAKDGAAK